MSENHAYALCGAVVGGCITAFTWVLLSVTVGFVLVAAVVGATLGAVVGLFAGAGVLQQAWVGRTGAVVISAVSTGIANLAVLLLLGAHGD
jgi:hypothetical protein